MTAGPRTLQGMPRVNEGRSLLPLITALSARRGHGVKLIFACTFTRTAPGHRMPCPRR